MKILATLAASTVAASLLSMGSNAITVADFEKIDNETQQQIYLKGLYDGMSLINSMIGEWNKSGEPAEETYCVPEKLNLNPSNLQDMIKTSMEKMDETTKNRIPVSLMLMLNLTEMFRCADK